MRRGRGELIRDLNRALVLNLAREQGVTSRASIARISGLSPSTVTSIVGTLLADGLLVEEGRDVSKGTFPGVLGRPATRLRVEAHALKKTRIDALTGPLPRSYNSLLDVPMMILSRNRTVLSDFGTFVRLSLRLLDLRGLTIIRSFGGPVI